MEVEPGTGGMLPLPGAREAPGAPPAASGCYAYCPAALLSGELTRGASADPAVDHSGNPSNPCPAGLFPAAWPAAYPTQGRAS